MPSRLDIICRPSYWVQNNSLSIEWDRELTWLLDHGFHFRPIDGKKHEVQLGPYIVWIANHPYASFRFRQLRPMRRTILRAYRQLVIDVPHMDEREREGLAEIRANQQRRAAEGDNRRSGLATATNALDPIAGIRER